MEAIKKLHKTSTSTYVVIPKKIYNKVFKDSNYVVVEEYETGIKITPLISAKVTTKKGEPKPVITDEESTALYWEDQYDVID